MIPYPAMPSAGPGIGGWWREDGHVWLMGLTQGKSSVEFNYNGEWVSVPAEVQGYVLLVSTSSSQEFPRQVEVSVDGAALVTADHTGNEVGRMMSGQGGVYALPINLSPGEHAIRVRNVSPSTAGPDDYVSVDAKVYGFGGFGGTLGMDEVREAKITIP